MKKSAIFPITLFGAFLFAVSIEMAAGPSSQLRRTVSVQSKVQSEATLPSSDTVIYPKDAYKLHRHGSMGEWSIADSLLAGDDTLIFEEVLEDTLPQLTARDTIKAPDSLRLTDPWRYRYYVALLDSLTHRQVADSLQGVGDSLLASSLACKDSVAFLSEDDSLSIRDLLRLAFNDSTLAEFNFGERHKLDSLYSADSTARAKAAFLAWYNALSKEERKKYDYEQKEKLKLAQMDSLDAIKAEKKAVRDSIRENTPRILDTYAFADSMFYKRLIAWQEDRDFGQIDPYVPDTTANWHFHDYPFLREDVNATWLGTAGSPVQNYNFFTRKSEGVSFYDALESWTFTPSTFVQYNTKTPYTELAYYGTLLAGDEKESDNIHIFTTQNITPALNFSLLYDSWNAGGMLVNEKVKNKTAAAGLNYIGKRYSANFGIIHNKVSLGENGGLTDISEIRDTTIELREVKVAMESAASSTSKVSAFADQQLSIPFNFINDWRAKRDSTFVPDSTGAITTAYIGHAIEYSTFGRMFENGSQADSLGQRRLDNKLYIRLQPWSADAVISKLDIGVGDYLQSYHNVTASDTSRLHENSAYVYAGASGRFGKHSGWDARAHSVFAGADAGNTDLSVGLSLQFFPFRRARKSPVSFNLAFSESLLNPTFYQRHFYSTIDENLRWDSGFSKISRTRIESSLKIPYWKMEAKVGYALLGNWCWYDTLGLARQYSDNVINVLSAYVRKEFVFFNLVHLDNRVLFQHSSVQDVLPLPELALNLKYYLQFPVQKGVMDMQIGAEAWWNSKWYSPQWNYITGTFANQKEWQYNNGPYFDLFINMQWKKATIFVKLQNVGMGWPMDYADYFSTHRHIITGNGTTGLKFGIWWPFYLSPVQNRQVSR